MNDFFIYFVDDACSEDNLEKPIAGKGALHTLQVLNGMYINFRLVLYIKTKTGRTMADADNIVFPPASSSNSFAISLCKQLKPPLLKKSRLVHRIK